MTNLFEEIEKKENVNEVKDAQSLIATTTLQDEILQVFNDTKESPFDRKCPISFYTFLVANYGEDYIDENFPNLVDYYVSIIGDDLNGE